VQHPSASFTVTATGGLLRILQTSCNVSVAYDPASGNPAPQSFPFIAIWDTGASASAISQKVIDACGLVPTGMTKVQTADGLVDAETFLVNISLPNNVGFASILVTKAKLGTSCDMLIGMDIINMGDFAITNKGGNTVFSFRVPSEVVLDFVHQHNYRMANPKQFSPVPATVTPPFEKKKTST
jgi:hypothetical protein